MVAEVPRRHSAVAAAVAEPVEQAVVAAAGSADRVTCWLPPISLDHPELALDLDSDHQLPASLGRLLVV